jgi:hypothetical protein
MSLRDDINIPVILVLGATTGLIVAVAIIGTQAGYNYVTQVDLARNYKAAEDRGILHFGENVYKPQADALKAEQPGWADLNKMSVRVSLDRAKELMIESKGKARGYLPPSTQPAKK